MALCFYTEKGLLLLGLEGFRNGSRWTRNSGVCHDPLQALDLRSQDIQVEPLVHARILNDWGHMLAAKDFRRPGSQAPLPGPVRQSDREAIERLRLRFPIFLKRVQFLDDMRVQLPDSLVLPQNKYYNCMHPIPKY